ncbi:MAG: hypothetical protein FJZ90_16420, partial [Chloroflexi bacterium]|nr:hypothetical protein [Chloroflexota bacterium]
MRRGLVFLLVMSLVLGCGAPSTPATPVVPPPTVTATPVPPTPTAPPTVTAPPVPPTAEPTTAPEEGEITLGALAVSDEEYVALLNLDAAIVVAQELVSKVAAGELGNDEVYRYLRGLEALWENASDALGSDPRSELVVTAWPAARDALAALEDALTFWAEDEGTSQETLELLQTAQEQMDRALALAAAAMADKYEVSLETMERLRLGARAEIRSV